MPKSSSEQLSCFWLNKKKIAYHSPVFFTRRKQTKPKLCCTMWGGWGGGGGGGFQRGSGFRVIFIVKYCTMLLCNIFSISPGSSWGGGGQGGRISRPLHPELPDHAPFPPLCAFPIVKYCANVAEFFPFLPAPAPIGHPASCPLFSHFPYASRPHYSLVPAPPPPLPTLFSRIL